MVKEAHCYNGLTEILNEVAIISSQITIDDLQNIKISIRKKKKKKILKKKKVKTNNYINNQIFTIFN